MFFNIFHIVFNIDVKTCFFKIFTRRNIKQSEYCPFCGEKYVKKQKSRKRSAFADD